MSHIPATAGNNEQELRSLWATISARETRLFALVEAMAQIVWITDAEGNVLTDPPQSMAHLSWSAFTGLSQQEIHGRGWAAALHPDDRSIVAAAGARARATGAPISSEFRVRHKSGEWRWVLCRGTSVRNDNGSIVGWIGTCTDITPIKQTEHALRESQQRLLAAMQAGEMSTWIWKLDDNTFWWDASGEKLWGLQEGFVHSHRIDDLTSLIHPDDRDKLSDSMQETLRNGVAGAVEFRTVRPDGKLQWLSSRGRVEKDANGNPALVIGAFADITKLKAAEESLRQAQKIQALGTLAGGIAHDFNNLLLAITGNVRLALSDLVESHPARASVQEIAKAGARATDLVHRILTFASQSPRDNATTPICHGVEDALKLVSVSVPGAITLRTQLCNAPDHASVNSTELQQIVVNLVTNAVHAIGECTGTVEVIVDVRDKTARLSVRDDGCGMDAATRERIFDPFYTTKPTGQGTGLGLAVVHGIVSSAGGTISVDSQVGVGTTIMIELPITSPTHSDDTDAARTEPRGAGQRIVYVDDDEAIVMLVTRTLQLLDYRVEGFTDSLQAAEHIAASHADIDVVVTDLSMPQLGGFDVARVVKRANANLPVILTSGYLHERDRELADQLGIEHIILKPNTVDELGSVLDRLCKELQARG